MNTEKSILIVDDEEMVREALEMVLERSGFKVTCVSNGQDALTLCENGAYDLVLSDLVMPEMDGVTLIRELRNNRCLTPIIAITGGARVGQMNLASHAVDAGACETLRKPISKKDLLDAIDRAFIL